MGYWFLTFSMTVDLLAAWADHHLIKVKTLPCAYMADVAGRILKLCANFDLGYNLFDGRGIWQFFEVAIMQALW